MNHALVDAADVAELIELLDQKLDHGPPRPSPTARATAPTTHQQISPNSSIVSTAAH
jgi:hypothetical protein